MNSNSHLLKNRVKQAAKGKWIEVFEKVGMSKEDLDGENHPCPKATCGGQDRFFAFDDVDDRGAVMCRKCHFENNGDGFSTIMWWLDCSFDEAVRTVAQKIGVSIDSEDISLQNIVEFVARTKKMPLDSFLKFGASAATHGTTIVARVPVYGADGKKHSYFDLDCESKGKFKKGKGNSGLFLPDRVPQPEETWLLVEGVKDAAALDGLGYSVAGLPGRELPAKFATLFGGVHVLLVPDLDDEGIKGANISALRLKCTAASVCIVTLPGEYRASKGDDVRDCLSGDGGPAQVRAAIESAVEWQPSDAPDEDRPIVVVTLDEATVAEQVLDHLSTLHTSDGCPETGSCRIFQRSGRLVHITRDPIPSERGITLAPSTPRITQLPRAIVRERITQAVRLVREVEKDEERVQQPVVPPDWLVAAIYDRGQFPANIPFLAGIVRCPSLRPDGTVVQEFGYDAATGFVYLPDLEYPRIPEKPSHEDALTGARELVELFRDFPFVDAFHESVPLALVLTLVARAAIPGPCPLYVFDATTPGSGKGLLCDVAYCIAYGTPAPRKSLPTTDAEMRKVITATAIEGIPACLLDNVASTLSFASLDAALTCTIWTDRILGKSETTGDLPMFAVWMTTGNNLMIGSDLYRRTIYCRLESPVDNPEERTDFHHPNLLGFVLENRARLAVAAVTVLRAYVAAGRPRIELPPCSYPEWSDLIRSALVWLGLPDPMTTRDCLKNADSSSQMLELLHAGFAELDPEGRGLTAAEIAEKLAAPISQDEAKYTSMRQFVAESSSPTNGSISRNLGTQFRKFKGRIKAGRRIQAKDTHGGVKRWFLESVDKPSS